MSDLTKLSNAEFAEHIDREATAMHGAPEGTPFAGSSHAFNWSDKPHRVLYDAVHLLREATSRLQAPAVAEVEAVARSDAKFDGRDFDGLGVATKQRYLDRAAAGIAARSSLTTKDPS